MNNLKIAIRRAKAIPVTTNYKDKCKAVHAWHKAIIEIAGRVKCPFSKKSVEALKLKVAA